MMKRTIRVLLAGAVLAGAGLVPAQAEQEVLTKSDNVKLVKNFTYDGGTELTAAGNFLYSGQLDGGAEYPSRGTAPDQGGMHIFNVKGKPKQAGFLHCPGNDNDVEAVRPGLVALGFHTNKCAPAAGDGFMLIDVKNPKKPRIAGMVSTGKNHTFKPVPGTNLIYTAGGGLGPGNGHGPAIVDVKDPANPKVVAEPKTITMDCHDISFSTAGERKLGFCAGAVGTGEVQIWDITDPLAPTTIGRIVNPAIQYSHYAVASPDGQLLAIDDEAFAAHDCNSGASPTGRVWIYDISNPQVPVVQSSFAPPRGGDGTANIGYFTGWIKSWCLSHGLDWMPDSRNLAVTWFTGGWSVLNLDDPLSPSEVAHFQADNSAAYSVLWHNGRLYSNDSIRGVDAFEIKGLKKQK